MCGAMHLGNYLGLLCYAAVSWTIPKLYLLGCVYFWYFFAASIISFNTLSPASLRYSFVHASLILSRVQTKSSPFTSPLYNPFALEKCHLFPTLPKIHNYTTRHFYIAIFYSWLVKCYLFLSSPLKSLRQQRTSS